jgi:hypothetical protein
MSNWALVRETQNPTYMYVGGGCYRVEAVTESYFAPSSEWIECHPQTRVGWYYEQNTFVSTPQFHYLRDNMYPAGGSPARAKNPELKSVVYAIIQSPNEFTYGTVMVDINNTTFGMLKTNLAKCIDQSQVSETSMYGTRIITPGSLAEAHSNHYSKIVMMRRLWAIYRGGEYVNYVDGKKITTTEQVCDYRNLERTLMKWFPSDEIVVTKYVRQDYNPQAGWPEWYDVVLDCLEAMIPG